MRSARRIIKDIKHFERILVLSDLNIGDALFTQALVSGLRDFFPTGTIDLAVNKSAAPLIIGNPEVTNVLPVFMGAPFPTNEDLATLGQIASPQNYDLVISLCPYFEAKHFPSPAKNVVEFSSFAALLINALKNTEETGHVIYQLYRFVHLLFKDYPVQQYSQDYSGIRLTLTEESVELAGDFLQGVGIRGDEEFILINPDTSSRFTSIPLEVLSALVKKLSKFDVPILIGSGHVDMGNEKQLLGMMSTEETKKLRVVPWKMPLGVYAALIDFSKVFVVGDCGPLHIAAARKYLGNGDSPLKNRTGLFSIFGATPARTYAYDSTTPGFFPANQDARSHAYVAMSRCRNITCINKLVKNCKSTRCFEFVDIDVIASDVDKALKGGQT